jgi:magnesium-transporting ATPase (P-type)
VADFIKSIGIYVAISTFVALVVNSVVKQLLYKEAVFTMDFIDDLINAVILSITIIVVAVPEGLPLAVTLSLAYSVN